MNENNYEFATKIKKLDFKAKYKKFHLRNQ